MTLPDDFREAVAEDQRLEILRALAPAPGYTAHEHLLGQALAAAGHTVSAAAVRGLLAWLDEAGLLVLTGARVQVAILTERGLDVARGAAHHPGVARPRP